MARLIGRAPAGEVAASERVDCPEDEVPVAGRLRGAVAVVLDRCLCRYGFRLPCRAHVAVFVDGQRVRDRETLEDPVRESSEVYVMQALTGG